MALAAVIALFIIGSISGGSSPPTPTSPCQFDWRQCTDNSDLVNNYGNISLIQSQCKSSATELAKYGEPKFPFISFGSFYSGTNYVKSGQLILTEKDAQFQNGFGAMVHSTVICQYDLNTGKILDINILQK